MKLELLNILSCPKCRCAYLKVEIDEKTDCGVKKGKIICKGCKVIYPIIDYIPRFIDSDKYVGSFSFEWKKHRRTQLDSANKDNWMAKVSEESFKNRVDFPLDELAGKLVLDVGCGMGRYSEIVSNYGGTVIGIDLSYAVDAAYLNLSGRENVHLLQADIFNLPFRKEIFDFIYSYGVLHHTPNASKAFKQLPPYLKKGGKISIFVYSAYNKGIVYTTSFWRFFTTRLPKRILYIFSFIAIPLYFIYKIPIIGNLGRMLFVIPMWPDWRWRVLDTFDWYSPKYQSKHTHWEVNQWFSDVGLVDIKIFPNEITVIGKRAQ